MVNSRVTLYGFPLSFSQAYKDQIKRESILTATSILNNPLVKARYELYLKVSDTSKGNTISIYRSMVNTSLETLLPLCINVLGKLFCLRLITSLISFTEGVQFGFTWWDYGAQHDL